MAAHVQQHLLYLVFQASSDSSQSEFSRRRIAEFRRRRSRKKVVLVITMAAVLSMLASSCSPSAQGVYGCALNLLVGFSLYSFLFPQLYELKHLSVGPCRHFHVLDNYKPHLQK